MCFFFNRLRFHLLVSNFHFAFSFLSPLFFNSIFIFFLSHLVFNMNLFFCTWNDESRNLENFFFFSVAFCTMLSTKCIHIDWWSLKEVGWCSQTWNMTFFQTDMSYCNWCFSWNLFRFFLTLLHKISYFLKHFLFFNTFSYCDLILLSITKNALRCLFKYHQTNITCL